MERRAKILVILAALIGMAVFSVYSIYSAIYPISDEQYVREAQSILHYSPPACRSLSN